MTDKLSKATVFILPLLDKSFTKELLLIDTKGDKDKHTYTFKNMYLLSDRVGLIFSTVKNNLRFKQLEQWFKSYEGYINTTIEWINNDWYTILWLQIPKNINFTKGLICSGCYNNISYEHKIRILEFWESRPASKLHSHLFDPDYNKEQFNNYKLPKLEQNSKEKAPRETKEPLLFIC